MQLLTEFSTVPRRLESSPGAIELPVRTAPDSPPRLLPPDTAPAPKAAPWQFALTALGIVGFLYVARPVVLPVFLACMAGMALKPLIPWLSYCRIPPQRYEPD